MASDGAAGTTAGFGRQAEQLESDVDEGLHREEESVKEVVQKNSDDDSEGEAADEGDAEAQAG